jgi:hypothetical protein
MSGFVDLPLSQHTAKLTRTPRGIQTRKRRYGRGFLFHSIILHGNVMSVITQEALRRPFQMHLSPTQGATTASLIFYFLPPPRAESIPTSGRPGSSSTAPVERAPFHRARSTSSGGRLTSFSAPSIIQRKEVDGWGAPHCVHRGSTVSPCTLWEQ